MKWRKAAIEGAAWLLEGAIVSRALPSHDRYERAAQYPVAIPRRAREWLGRQTRDRAERQGPRRASASVVGRARGESGCIAPARSRCATLSLQVSLPGAGRGARSAGAHSGVVGLS